MVLNPVKWFFNKIRDALHLNNLNHQLQEVVKTVDQIKLSVDELVAGHSDLVKGDLRQIHAINGLRNRINDLIISNKEHFPQLKSPGVKIECTQRLAINSNDHLFPRGVAHDNTHYPRLVNSCESIFGQKIKYLDLGCAGGGLVWDFLLAGNLAIGLEGSDYAHLQGKGEWPILDQHLFNCDISKEFKILNHDNNGPVQFDAIGCWDVLEHIVEDDIPQLLINVKEHLRQDGLFLASVATFDDWDHDLGINWHTTVQPETWWRELVEAHGFRPVDDLLQTSDFPRGSGNGPDDWDKDSEPDRGFHLVLRKTTS